MSENSKLSQGEKKLFFYLTFIFTVKRFVKVLSATVR